MLKQLSEENFEAFYSILENSFPPTERRTKAGQKDLFSEPKYKIFGIFNADELAAFIAVWEFKEFAFVEHFAVASKHRNKGLGGSILKELSKQINKTLVLEVEPPETDIAARRIEFYKRNGFYFNNYDYTQPSMAVGQPSIPLRIMSFSRPLSQAEFVQVKDTLYSGVYKVNFDL